MIELTESEFLELVSYIQSNYGINLSNKKQLIEGRMSNYLESKGISNFSQYIRIIKTNNSEEVTNLINRLTTNHTFFYREDTHYKFMKEQILPAIEAEKTNKTLELWSAGCSSGEEAYTAAMALDEYFSFKKSAWKINIVATDISKNVLSKAKLGIYGEDSVKNLPIAWKNKYLVKTNEGFKVTDNIKKSVDFSVFNLMNQIPFNFKNRFDIVFCRNVMIYFDLKTKSELIIRLYDAVKPGGYLFIGHSETVPRDCSSFKYIKPAIYKKV